MSGGNIGSLHGDLLVEPQLSETDILQELKKEFEPSSFTEDTLNVFRNAIRFHNSAIRTSSQRDFDEALHLYSQLYQAELFDKNNRKKFSDLIKFSYTLNKCLAHLFWNSGNKEYGSAYLNIYNKLKCT